MATKPFSTLEIRLISHEDLEFAEQLLLAGYGGQPGRIPELNRLLEIQPDGWFFAWRDGQPSGMGGAVLYDYFAYLGMMVVLPSLQRQGIGRRIFEAILEWISYHDRHLALLDATEAGAALYRQYGFSAIDQVRQYICSQLPLNAHPSPSINEVTFADLPQLAEFDAPLFGSNRAKVFQTYLQDFQGRFLFKHSLDGQITGYLLAQPNRLGAWAALTPDDASELLEAAFALPFEGEVNVIVPAVNQWAEKILASAGFQFEHALSHMANGLVSIPRRRDLIYGQISFAVG